MGRQALALLRQLDAACASADDLEAAAIESFNQHPDAGIITSFPGLGPLTGARVLAEIGDDRSRFTDARGLKAYAGAAPITRASGKTRSVTRRHVKNNRLAAAGYIWAFSALTASPGARAHYDRRRDAGDRHAAAQRNLFNRLLGCLHHCLATGQHYDETIAFPARPPPSPQPDSKISASYLTTKEHRMSWSLGCMSWCSSSTAPAGCTWAASPPTRPVTGQCSRPATWPWTSASGSGISGS